MGIKMDFVIRNQSKLSLTKGRWTAGRHRGIRFAEIMKASTLGLVVSFVTPMARVGGEPVKIYMLRKNDISTAVSTAIVAVDTFTEMFSYYIIVMVSMLFVLLTGVLPYAVVYPFLLILLISSALLATFLAMCFNYSILCKVVRLAKWAASKMSYSMSRRLKESKTDYAWMFYDIFRLMMTNKLVLLKIFALSFFVKLLEFLRIYFIFLAFGYGISFSTILIAWSIILLVGMVPFLPGGLGLVEASGTYAYMLFGIAKPLAGAVMIIDRLLSYWLVIFIGMGMVSYSRLASHSLSAYSYSRSLAAQSVSRLKRRLKRKYSIPEE
jgi:uncharacterized protein (TIRG00374 family)